MGNPGLSIDMLYAIIIIFALLTSIISLKFFIVPYVWICFAWFIALIYILRNTKNNNAKAVCWNVSVVLLLFGVLEICLWAQDREMLQFKKRRATFRDEFRNKEGELLKSRVEDHDVLGYVSVKSTIFWKRYSGDDLVFDVSYTINDKGLRISPPYREETNLRCVIFFGCSYTFGAGVDDNETMPYLVGLKTDAKYRIYNFGFSGYGPHQMLASIEHGMVTDIIECEPDYVIYTAIIQHAFRSAGNAIWDWHGPKYIMSENGEVVYQGHFDDEKVSESIITKKVKNQLKKSHTITRFFSKPISKDDIGLTVGIIDTSKKILKTNYPKCEFHVILWNKQKIWMIEELLSGLKEKGIQVHLISDILPDYYDKKSKYQLSDMDEHPNQLAYELIAEYIGKKIIGE